MSIILWVVVGALAGWIASIVTGDNARQGWLGNIIVGIVGAFVGGWLVSLLIPGTAGMTGFNLSSLLIAILGAVIVLFIYNAVTGRKTV